MKQAYFVRHGKSSWDSPALYDHDRPLKQRGLDDAHLIARELKQLQVRPDLVCSSSSIRTRQTSEIFLEYLDVKLVDYYFELYHAGMHEILKFASKLDDKFNCVLFFGHNPAYTDLINAFSTEYIVNVPTCGAFQIDFSIDSWRDLDISNGVLQNRWFPKMYK